MQQLREATGKMAAAMNTGASNTGESALVEGVHVESLLRGIEVLQDLYNALIQAAPALVPTENPREWATSWDALLREVETNCEALCSLYQAVKSDEGWCATGESICLVLKAWQCCRQLEGVLEDIIDERTTCPSSSLTFTCSSSTRRYGDVPQECLVSCLWSYWEPKLTAVEMSSLQSQLRPFISPLNDSKPNAAPSDWKVLILASSDSAMLFSQSDRMVREGVSALRRWYKKNASEQQGGLEELSRGIMKVLARSSGSTWGEQALQDFLTTGDKSWPGNEKWQHVRAQAMGLAGQPKGLVVLCKNIILLAGARVGDVASSRSGKAKSIAHVLASSDENLKFSLLSSENDRLSLWTP